MYFKFDALEVATAETGAPHPRASLDGSLADLPTGGTTCYSGRVPEGGWPLPGPIPSSYYSRRALPNSSGLARARNRLGSWVSFLEGIRLPRFSGRERLAADVAAAAIVMLGVIIGLGTHGSPSGARWNTAGPTQPHAAGMAPAPTVYPQTTPVATTPTPLPTPTPISVVFVNAPLTTDRGEQVTLRVRTAAHTPCSISIGYPNAPELSPVDSGADGTVAWRWQVRKNTPRGSWPIDVSCGSGTGTTQININ